jgi:hypothetical protein
MAKIAKTGDRKKVMDTNKSTDCPKCSKPTRIVKRVKDRERGTPGGVYISCSACDFFEKLSAPSTEHSKHRIGPGDGLFSCAYPHAQTPLRLSNKSCQHLSRTLKPNQSCTRKYDYSA